jgi:hypothetical protein
MMYEAADHGLEVERCREEVTTWGMKLKVTRKQMSHSLLEQEAAVHELAFDHQEEEPATRAQRTNVTVEYARAAFKPSSFESSYIAGESRNRKGISSSRLILNRQGLITSLR